MSFAENMNFGTWINELGQIHKNLECTQDNTVVEADEAFSSLYAKSLETRESRQQLFLIGNGASASMASHIAADLCKNGNLATRCFSDASLLTALANDCGVEEMFATPLKQQAKKGDLLVCISSSGESPNIIHATKMARELGMYIVTLSAMNNDNSLRQRGDINFYVPAKTYGFAETAHAALLHYWVDMIVEC